MVVARPVHAAPATWRSPPERSRDQQKHARVCTPFGEHVTYAVGDRSHLSLRAVGDNVPPSSAAQAAGLVRSGPQLVLPFPRFVRPVEATQDDVRTHPALPGFGLLVRENYRLWRVCIYEGAVQVRVASWGKTR